MTGFLHEKEFSRKSFLQSGGALIVGFSLAGIAGKAQAATSPFASNGPYDHFQVDSWITINADNTASVMSGNMEIGQGTSTGMLQVAGEELDMDIAQLRWFNPDTNLTPRARSTTSSSSIRSMSPAVRAAAASAKQELLRLASASLGVPIAGLTVKSGVVSGGGRSVKYGDLLGGKVFNVKMPASYNLTTTAWNDNLAVGGLLNGAPGTKPVSQYQLVGTRVPRIDIPARIVGNYSYVHSVKVPGMLHGRVIWPRGQATYGSGMTLLSVDESSIKSIPNARIVRKGDFIGVVAPMEYDAIQAAAQLKVKWSEPLATQSGNGGLWSKMRADDAAGQAKSALVATVPDFAYNINAEKVDAALASAAHVVSATYKYQYNGHMPIGPSCCVADVTPNGAVIFSNTQDAYGTRSLVASVLGMPENVVRVLYHGGSSSYGSAPYNEAAQSAALMSQLAGAPVRLQFMRWDEHGYDNYGPAILVDARAGVDANGKIVATDWTGFAIPTTPTGTVSQLIGTPVAPQGSQRAVPTWGMLGAQYTMSARRTIEKTLPTAGSAYGLRTGALRSVLGMQNVFAYEQLIDELAYAAKIDPYLFRVQNVATNDGVHPWYNTDRWLGVLNAAAKAADWKPRVAASNLSDENVVRGRGIASAPHAMSLATVIAEIEVNKKTGKIVVKHLYMAQDSGLTINPGLVENQMTGGVIMATSRVLVEEVRFSKSRVTSLDWVSYPILRFKDAPKVTAIVIQRPELRPSGAGEAPEAPTSAAIANAFFDATGVRLRESPLTPARVRATLAAAKAGTYK
jgi:CO/xanthine dehydrogenase Mo-binding subunit